ncbi:hypothetical protein Tco_0168435 [Tanacetum coccineum]
MWIDSTTGTYYKKVDEDPRKNSECKDQEKEDNVNSTNNVNIVSLTVNAAGTNEVNVVGGKTSIELPFDPNMPALEDDSIFDFSRDDEDDGVVASDDLRDALSVIFGLSELKEIITRPGYPYSAATQFGGVTLGSRYEIGESSTARPTEGRGVDYGFVSTVDAEARRQGISEVGYGIKDTWVDPTEAVPEVAPMTVGEVSTRVIELAELHEHDTHDLYALLEDAQDRDSVDGGRGGLCFPRGLGSLDRIESGDPSGASDPPNVQTARPCYYADFMKCQPLNFKGTEGVVGLTRWIEKMEPVFNISGGVDCAMRIRYRGICNDLGRTQEENDEQSIVHWSSSQELDEDDGVGQRLDGKSEIRTLCGKSDNKGRRMIHPGKTPWHQHQPFKKQNVAKVYNMGDGEKKPYGETAQEYGHFIEDCPKLKNKDGVNGMHKVGFMQVGNAREREWHRKLGFNIVTGTDKSKITVKSEQTRTRESKEYKAEAPKDQSLSPFPFITSPRAILAFLEKLTQTSHQGNDTLAILRCPQIDPTSHNIDQNDWKKWYGRDEKFSRARQRLEASAWH